MDLTLDPHTTALVLIDLQRSIIGRQLAPHSSADVIRRSAQLAAAHRAKGGTVAYVNVLSTEILQRPTDRATPRPTDAPPPNASEIVPEAGMQPGDLLITKRQWGAFYGTHLEQQLRRRQIQTIILGGIATNIGVESTARAAHDHGYTLIFAEDAMSSLSPDLHAFAVDKIFPLMGRVRSTEQILAALS